MHGLYVHACVCSVLGSLYLKDLDGIGPVGVGVLPRLAIRQALSKHVQIENGVVFRVLDLTLKQFHDVQESLQRAADVYNYRRNKDKKQDVYLHHLLAFSEYCFSRNTVKRGIFLILMQQSALFCLLSATYSQDNHWNKMICTGNRLK